MRRYSVTFNTFKIFLLKKIVHNTHIHTHTKTKSHTHTHTNERRSDVRFRSGAGEEFVVVLTQCSKREYTKLKYGEFQEKLSSTMKIFVDARQDRVVMKLRGDRAVFGWLLGVYRGDDDCGKTIRLWCVIRSEPIAGAFDCFLT